MQKYAKLSYVVLAIIIIAVLAVVLAVPIGVADGGGLYKTLEGLGLSYKNEPSPDYFDVKFSVSGPANINNTLSLFNAVVIGKNAVEYDIRKLALLYSALFVIAIMLIIKSGIRKDKFDLPFGLLCTLIFADVAYIAYYNTLYTEGAIHVTFMAMCAFLLLCYSKKSPQWYFVLPATIFALLFAFCGVIQALVAVLFAFLIIRLMSFSDKIAQKAICAVMGGAVLLISIIFAANYKSIDYEKNIYNAVFFGVAKHESVSALGLNENLDGLCNVFYSEQAIDKYNLNETLYNKISYAKIAKYYLTHPFALAKEVNIASKNAYNIRANYLGNYLKESLKPKELTKLFSLYSTLKTKFIPNTLLFTSLFWGLYFGVLIYIVIKEKQYKHIAEFGLCLGCCAVLSLVMPLFLTGGVELGRELFTYYLLFDSAIVFAFCSGGRYMYNRRKLLQKKYGVDQ